MKIAPLPSSPPSPDRNLTDITTDRISPSQRKEVIDRSKVDPKVLAAADGMEAVFLDMMMKEMRQSVGEDPASPSSQATKIYTSMFDSEVAQRAAEQGGLGISDSIIAYLQSNGYTGNQGPAQRTGGTSHEGQLKSK